MRVPLIAGNWKMHMTRPQAKELVRGLKARLKAKELRLEVALAPPFTALETVASEIADTGWILAAQNAFWEKQGAFTGEVSFGMLADIGCKMVIIGHSERRQIFFESDEWVGRKVRACLEWGLIPIVCVGETLEEREKGLTLKVVERQLEKALEGLEEKRLGEFVVAYEPVWAIGTGRTATPEQAQEVHAMVRKWLSGRFSPERAFRAKILYGGSVKPENIYQLMECPDIDGALVGGASLDPEGFAKIVEEADRLAGQHGK